jgi:2-dehydro-3-deoxyglucarate aldolase
MSLRQRLKNKEFSLGTWLTIGHPSIAEILCDQDFDWITLDMEHTSMTLETAQGLLNVIQGRGKKALIRVSRNDDVLVKKAMDIGSDGVIIPNICNLKDAKDAIDHTLYPPTGKRGVGLFRAQGYGYKFEKYLDWLENEAVIIGQLEHIDALENIKDILSVERIDGFIVGPYDLSASMGYPGEFNRADVKQALKGLIQACKDAGKSIGFHQVQPDPALLLEKISVDGFNFAAYGTDFYFLADKIKSDFTQIHQGLSSRRQRV